MLSWKHRGFTLIELLVVIGVLAVLLAIVLLAINPSEQLSRANDVASKAIAQDFVTSTIQYLTSVKALPWNKDPSCQTELNSGQTLAGVPSCVHDLVNDGKLEQAYNNASQLKDIYITKCGNSAVLCYNPKSKIEYQQAETQYNKFGVVQPGCPGLNGPSPDCYWCKPVMNDPQCLVKPTPTPTPSPTPTPDPATLYSIGGYKLDDPKFFQTYAVLAFPDPGIPPNWEIDVSMRPDFGGTTSWNSIGYYVNGVAATSNTDTIFWVAYAGDGNFGSLTSPSYAAQESLTSKHFAFISMPYEWSQYVNGCGKKIYWRVVEAPNGGSGYYATPSGPVYTNTIDCTTKVGVEPIGTWGALPQDDFNKNGVFDNADYIIGSLWTKFRAGGWQPPE